MILKPLSQVSVNGTMRILRQAHKARVPKFILTSSYVSIMDLDSHEAVFRDYTYTEAGAFRYL